VGAETGGRERRNRPAVGPALERKEKKRQQSCSPNFFHGKVGGKGTSNNDKEDTEDVATLDDIDEGGDKKTTAKTLTADSKLGNNNDGDGNNKNNNEDENENEDDNGNEEKESEN
jgi:hypothetical protein